MLILNNKINKSSLNNLDSLGESETFFEDMIKCVVDINRGLIAINAELHSDLEELLIQSGSDTHYLYGINDFHVQEETLRIQMQGIK